MITEQTTIKAIIRNLDGKFANVEVEHGGCGHCHEEGGCGGQQLTQMFCSGQKTYLVENTIGADVGDRATPACAIRGRPIAWMTPVAASGSRSDRVPTAADVGVGPGLHLPGGWRVLAVSCA